MGKNTELGYSQYFKRGLLNNFSHVTFSLIVSSITSIILFTKLSNSDYILYSVSQITVYFFVNFASLEFGKIIRKFIPNMDKNKSDLLIKTLLRTAIIFLSLIFSIYFFVSSYFDIYQIFENKQILFFLVVLTFSAVQICINFNGEYLAAKQKFDKQEKLNLYFSVPVRVIFISLFYFVYPNLIFALIGNFLIRITNLIITLKVSKVKYFVNQKAEKNFSDLFSLKNNLVFTFKNFIFFNYPLIFFSYLPIYLENFHNENDIAVLALSISLFNSIKPILNGILSIINPAIQQLNNPEGKIKLNKIVSLTFELLNKITMFIIAFVFLCLNFLPFTQKVLSRFSYNLFVDLALTALILSLFYILNLIFHSYALSVNNENYIMYSSLLSFLVSLGLWLSYDLLGKRINLVLIIILSFYLINFLILSFLRSELFKEKRILFLFTLPLYIGSLKTAYYDNIFLFVFGLISISIFFLIQLNKVLKKHNVSSNFQLFKN